jgi:hypothetical protein
VALWGEFRRGSTFFRLPHVEAHVSMVVWMVNRGDDDGVCGKGDHHHIDYCVSRAVGFRFRLFDARLPISEIDLGGR